jgi:hypothetical protein
MNQPLPVIVRNFGRSTALIVCVAAAASQLMAGKNDPIAISATSAPGYIRPTDPQGNPQPETYIFAEGVHLGAGTADRSQDTMTFDDITKMLAVNLAKQEYYPTRDVPAANILIRVFWGSTLTFDDSRKQLEIEALNSALGSFSSTYADTQNADVGELNASLDRVGTSQSSQQSMVERNAALLGYRRSLDKERKKAAVSTQEMTMSVELNEERYFVVLMAYDYQFMRKEKKPKLLWVTRLSMRSPGNNFSEALPALAFAGAEVYGKSLEGLQRVRVNERDVEVKMGELQVLGTVGEIPAEKK